MSPRARRCSSVGVVVDAGSLASGIACGTIFAEGLGRAIDNGGPNEGQFWPATAATCALNVALGVAGIVVTTVGAKKLDRGRAVHYSLNSVTVRF